MAGLSSKLTSLVKAAEDPYIPLYAFTHLGAGVPPNDSEGFYSRVLSLRRQVFIAWFSRNSPMERLKRLQMEMQTRQERERQEIAFLNAQERQLSVQLFQSGSLNVMVRKIGAAKPEELKPHLLNNEALIRLLVIHAVGQRRIHLEADVIDRLTDPDSVVRAAAHKALVRLARGTDFGPVPGASQHGIERSVEKWRQWLALQQDQSATATVKDSAKSTRKVEPLEAVQLVLDHSSRELQTAPAEVTRLSEELVKAQGDEQMSVLARLRDAKGIDNTDALALAIPRLSGGVQRQARDALAQRLMRMTAATLRDKLQDDNVEVRRAAASACGRKGAKEHIPHLRQLLDDPEVAVIQAARRALRDLTGQDFGPDEGADRRARASAADAWRKWCKEHADAPK